MNKQNKNILIGAIIIVIAISFLILYGGNIKFLATDIPEDCSNMQILSVSKVDVSTGDEEFYKPKIVVQASVGGSHSDCLAIKWNKDLINSKLKESGENQYVATKDISSFGYLTLDKFERRAGVVGNNRYLKSIKTQNIGNVAFCTDNTCKDNMGNVNNIGISLNSNSIGIINSLRNSLVPYSDCICIYNYNKAEEGSWSLSSYEVPTVTMSFTGLGEKTLTGSQGIIDTASFKDFLGNMKARVQFNGYLGSGHQFTLSTDKYKPVRDIGAGEWYLIGTDQILDISSEYTSSYNSLDNPNVNAFSYNSQYVSNIENLFSFSSLEQISINSLKLDNPAVTNVRKSQEVDGTTYYFDISKDAPSYPTFTITLDAEWVGIKKLVTKPRIECLQDKVTIDSSQYKNLPIVVHNDGTSSGTIIVKADCDKSISAAATPRTYTIKARGSADGIVKASGTAVNLKDVFGTCTITATDGTDESKTSKCNIDIQVKATTCKVPGETRCSADMTKVLICNKFGQEDETECPYGCKDGKCLGESQIGKNCPTSCEDDTDCGPCGKISGSNFTCIRDKCVPPSDIGCSNCFGWAYSKLQPNYCSARKVYEFKIGDIVGWHAGPSLVEVDQSTICPVIITFMVVVTIILIAIIILLIKKAIDKRKFKK